MSKIDNLLAYYEYARQRGHTTLMIEGAFLFQRPGVMVFSTMTNAKEAFDRYREVVEYEFIDKASMTINNVKFTSIHYLNDDLRDSLRGLRTDSWPAIVVDHYALQILIDEDRKEKEL